jgi:hypothetical protein
MTVIQFSSGQFLPAIRFREQGNHKITALVLENIPMVMAPWSEHGDGTSCLQSVANSKGHLFIDVIRKAVSTHYLLYELLLNSTGNRERAAPRFAWLVQNLVEHRPAVQSRVQNRRMYEVISEPRVSLQSILSQRGARGQF